MIVSIYHTVTYTYSGPVFLEPFTVRLRPHSDHRQRLRDYHLTIAPHPAGLSQCLESDGNSATIAWFEGLHERLVISSTSRVETEATNPFDFLIIPADAAYLPLKKSGPDEDSLAPYLHRPRIAREVDDFADAVCSESDVQTVPFLMNLCSTMASGWKRIVRPQGEPQAPLETLRSRSGACRDLAVLFMDCCRSLGLPARFVSGYHLGEAGDDGRDLHAWAEVYVPGGGWRGFDPSCGIATAGRHVAVAAASVPHRAAPTDGTFRGDGTTDALHYDIRIETEME